MGNHDSSNLYAFAGADPVNGNDPTGNCEGACIGAIAGSVIGGGYADYRSLAYGEDFRWKYVGQGAIAGAAIGFGIETLGAGSGLSALVIGGIGIGSGTGGAVSSVSSDGDWGAFSKGSVKGGVIGGVGALTGYGIGAAGLSGGWAFAGSVAADAWVGVGGDYLFGDCDEFSGCVGANAAFSLGGNAIGYGAVAAFNRFLPKAIPGTRGIVNGGDSQVLGRNLMSEMGHPNQQTWRPYQAQHIIPTQHSGAEILQRVGMDLDHASNGIFLPRSSPRVSALSKHLGFHAIYNDVVGEGLENISRGLPTYMAERQVLTLQQRLRQLQMQGTPLYGHGRPGGGATRDLWRRLLGL